MAIKYFYEAGAMPSFPGSVAGNLVWLATPLFMSRGKNPAKRFASVDQARGNELEIRKVDTDKKVMLMDVLK